jgi:aminoglycoside phosphotransferase family enzyme
MRQLSYRRASFSRIRMARQEEVVAFLSDGASYGLPGAPVERIETHCSVVFLLGNRAYKLKRAVAFSSLDYTTLARREAACRAELELNRRTAPDLYIGIQAIRRRPTGGLSFDGRGPIVDWVVVMRRFSEADLLEHLADAGKLTPELMSALADEIARFHESAERMSGFGGADGLRQAIEENRTDQKSVEAILGRDAIEALYAASLRALDRVALLLDRRREWGRVRRCHGDLRLANICLLDGRPTLFDAIEFSDRISCIDVMFDLAFLLMDLRHRGLEALADILFDRYLDVTGDTQELSIMPLLLSVRAATRAYTLAAAVGRQASEEQARFHLAAARSLLALGSSLVSGHSTATDRKLRGPHP